MKIPYFSIMILTASLGIVNNIAFADNADEIDILHIHTTPTSIKVGDVFKITATLANNSPVPIFLQTDDCKGPFVVAFSNHVVIQNNNMTCAYALFQQTLDSNENTTKTSPGITLVYKAIASGAANATITFSYYTKNQTDPSQPEIKQTVSKSFLFTMYDNNITDSLNMGKHPDIRKLLSPLRQFKSGVASNDIICRPDMQLLIQNQEDLPICAKLGSVSSLLHRDWSYPADCKYVHGHFTAGVEGLVMIEKNASNQFSDKSYFPENSTVVIGWNNTISWINQDVTPSSVTSDWNLFDSGPILPGADWTHNFECAGNYGYHSEPHPWMKGWIRVLPPSG